MTRTLDSEPSGQFRHPVRMCLGCRLRADKSELLRVTASGGLVLPDPRARAAGRGAYVHPRLGCVEQAIKRRAWASALRVSAALDPAPVLAWAAARNHSSEQAKERNGMSDR